MAEATQSEVDSSTVEKVTRGGATGDVPSSEVESPTVGQVGRTAPTKMPVHPMEHVALAKASHSVADSDTVGAVSGVGATEVAPSIEVASDAVDRVAPGVRSLQRWHPRR